MTPLAHRFAKELTLLRKDRLIEDKANIIPRLERAHSFDCSSISVAVNDALDQALDDLDYDQWLTIANLLETIFLPAEVTWLEFGQMDVGNQSDDHRMPANIALILEQERDGWLRLDLALQPQWGEPWAIHIGRVRKGTILDRDRVQYEFGEAVGGYEADGNDAHRMSCRFVGMAMLALDIINQPTLCRIKTHQPHRGLERALRRSAVGRYPLLAWHEVLIKPQDRPLTREEEEGHLTGRKCLHFVRSHRRRYRDGTVTLVTHHWRGDPALGIARTRYRVEGAKRRTA